MKHTAKTIGTWFEKKCKTPLEKLCLRKGRMFYNFPDSASSRGLIPAQPGEFLIMINGKALLVECKASVKHETFRSCMSSMVRDAQYGWHKKWHLSGNPSVFIFYSDVTKELEFWDGRVIVQARSNSKSLPKGGYKHKVNIPNEKFEDSMILLLGMRHEI